MPGVTNEELGNTLTSGIDKDNIHISKADGMDGPMGLYEVQVNGQSQYMTKRELESTNAYLSADIDTLRVNVHVSSSENDVSLGRRDNDLLVGGCGLDALIDGGDLDWLMIH